MRKQVLGIAVALLVCVAGSPVQAEHERHDARQAVDRGTHASTDVITVSDRHRSRSYGSRYGGHSQSFRSTYSRYYGGGGHSAGCGCGHCRQAVAPAPGYRHYQSYRTVPRGYYGGRSYGGYRSAYPSSGFQYYGRGFGISIQF